MQENQSQVLRIAVVDDHPVTRFALRSLIESEPGWTVVCECEDPDAMLAAIPRDCPDVIVVDLNYENNTGFSLLEQIKKNHPGVRTLVYSANAEREYADRCFRVGAIGYICKDEPVDNVREAISCVVKGYTYISESLVDWVADQCSPPEDDAA